MKNKFDNILLSTLWLTIALLGTSLWFNIMFGFNIFSKANWNHLAYMQAAQQPINNVFYLSLTVSVFITIFGLYLLIRPRYRKIKLHTPSQPQASPTITKPVSNETWAIALERPKRLNTGLSLPTPAVPSDNDAPVYRAAPVPSSTNLTAPVAPNTPASNWDKSEISKIFEDAKYTIKPTPKIQGLPTLLFAIGSDETVWIGAGDCQPADLSKRIEAIQQVFYDTLDDVDITVNGFILNKTAPHATPDILVFDSTESLRNYINAHPNTPPDPEKADTFEAFSSYISTVIEYLGQI